MDVPEHRPEDRPEDETRPPPDGLAARAATVGDAEAIAHVVNVVSLDEVGVPWVDAAQIRDDLTRPRTPGLDDVVLVDRSATVVGYLGFGVTPDPFEVDVMCCVEPALSGRGANAWLLRLAETRAMSIRPDERPFAISVGRFLGIDAAARLFTALGYRYARTFRMMAVDLDAPPTPPAAPHGVVVRPFDRARDEAGVHRALDEAFDDHWGPPFHAIEEWRRLAMDGEGAGFDPGLWFVALEGGDIVGALAARPSSPRNEHAAYVSDLGVRRAWRRRGIARALLLSVFAEAHRRGIPRVELGVDAESPTGALDLYELVGMRTAYGWEIWQKTV